MNKKGFTLVELLVVIVILGLIMIVVATTAFPAMNKAKMNSLETYAMRLVEKAKERCIADNCTDGTKYTVEDLMGENAEKSYVGSLVVTDTGKDYKVSGTIETKDGKFVAKIAAGSDKIEIVKTGDKTSVHASQYIISKASKDELWDSPLEGDGYRYVGTNPDNYVCFGYTDAETDCDFSKAENTDKYAYRVIGIFEDDNGVEHVKLIKKEALNAKYAWNEDSKNDINWDESDLYDNLNGDAFLTNTTYMPTGWNNKIATWDYTMTNTLTYKNDGPDYREETVQNVYLHEMNRSSKTSIIGEWRTATSKISLMYESDYLLSLGSSALNYTSNSNKTTLKTGWMHLGNNDTSALSSTEWTMTRFGIVGGYIAWHVNSYGAADYNGVNSTLLSRPVFHLTTDTTITGTGTIESPFIVNK